MAKQKLALTMSLYEIVLDSFEIFHYLVSYF